MAISLLMRIVPGFETCISLNRFCFSGGSATPVSELMKEYGVGDVVYGHLHGAGIQIGFTGEHNGISYHLVSCDSIGFEPKEILL